MKKVMLTALTISLLAGTSAFAGSGGAVASVHKAQNGLVGRTMQEAQRRSEGQNRTERQRPAEAQRPAPQQAAPQQVAPQEGARQGGGGRGGRDRGPEDNNRGPRPGQAQVAPGQAVRPTTPPRASGSFAGRTLEDAQRRAEAQGRGGDWNNNGRGRGPDWNNGRGGRDGDWNNGRGGNWNNNNGRGPDWDRDRWNRDRNRPRFDQRYWPHFVQPRQRYRWYGSPWLSQPGFYYRDWGYGEVLPWSWYTPNYYLNDYWRYGLPLPPAGYEWVRVGRDVMLVDVFTGRIQQVVRYLFF